MGLPIFSLSDSDSTSEKESDLEDYIFGDAFASSNDPKTKSKNSKSVLKPQPSSKKPKMPRKTDEEKRLLREEKERAKEEKRKIQEEAKNRLMEEKLKAAEEKQRQKEEKKKTGDLLKQIKPGECMKFVSVFIDFSLVSCKFGVELVAGLRDAKIKYEACHQPVPGTISWKKDFDDPNISVPDHVLVVWLGEKLIDLISSNNLNATVKELLESLAGYKVTILIFEIEEYFRKKKTLDNRAFRARVLDVEQPIQIDTSSTNLSRDDVEMELACVQLMLNVQYHFLETKEEMGLFVSQYTKAIAQLAYKSQRNQKQKNLDWFAEADSRESVRVDHDGNGLLRLWQQQICQFPCVGLDTAQAVVSQYSSPTCLMEAYDRCSTQKEGELLLQDIQVRRGQGINETCRRVGPELSKKVYKFFNSADGNLMLSKED